MSKNLLDDTSVSNKSEEDVDTAVMDLSGILDGIDLDETETEVAPVQVEQKKEVNVLKTGYYSDDLNAEEFAENGIDPDKLKEDQDLPVTSGDLSIGDLDDDNEPIDPSESYDEENMAGGEDNVVSDD